MQREYNLTGRMLLGRMLLLRLSASTAWAPVSAGYEDWSDRWNHFLLITDAGRTRVV